MAKKTESPSAPKKLVDHRQPKEPAELTDREVYDTPIGPVCMSKVEHEEYLEQAEFRRELEKAARNTEKG